MKNDRKDPDLKEKITKKSEDKTMNTKILATLLSFAVILTILTATIPNAKAFQYVATLEVVNPIPLVLSPEAMHFSPAGDFTAEIVDCGLGYPGDFPPNVAGKIALIERGLLLFWQKTQNAAAAGAMAAIIYNNVPGSLIGSLLFITDIPAAAISDSEGALLLSWLASRPVTVHLTVGPALAAPTADVKPGSWPNPLNIKGKGVLPVALCGTAEIDVTTIDPETIRLTLSGAGAVPPLRWSYEDVATPFIGDSYDGHDLEGDGFLDLTFKFKTQDVVDELFLDLFSDGDVVTLTILGNFKAEFGGAPFAAGDYAIILKK